MIANMLEGMEHEAAARLAGLSRSAAYEWHNRYEEAGLEGLRDRPRQDEARIGQKNSLTRVWGQTGSRPVAPKDLGFASAYLFGAVGPSAGKACPRESGGRRH